ncbi:MAG: gliding motility protein RemB, partial [Flavobacteriales bacterium]
DNALLGLNVRWKVSKSSSIYGQLMLDEFLLDEVRAGNGWWGNKQAAQLGVKSFSLFGIKDLNFQSEINFARPFTYQHRSGSQNYSHYNQALAHPLGADFVESITFVNYRWRNFFAELKVQVAQMGRDTSAANLGNNIFLSYDTRPQDYGYDMFTGREC